MILFDTNILIEVYRNNQEIIEEVRLLGEENAVTAGELVFGERNKRELVSIKKDIKHLTVIEIDTDISKQFLKLLSLYSLSHGLDIPDALIASSAMKYDLELYTLNTKDFKFIEGLRLYQRIG